VYHGTLGYLAGEAQRAVVVIDTHRGAKLVIVDIDAVCTPANDPQGVFDPHCRKPFGMFAQESFKNLQGRLTVEFIKDVS
jgi:hypothetical protein